MKMISQIVQLLTCILLIAAVAVNKNHRLFGNTLDKQTKDEAVAMALGLDSDEWTDAVGRRVISTRRIAKDIWGFGGSLPMYIYLKDNLIDSISLQANSESPEFLSAVVQSGLLHHWDGLSPREALQVTADAVSGATLSSTAIIRSVRQAMQYAIGEEADFGTTALAAGVDTRSVSSPWRDVRFWCVLAVVLCGLVVPFFIKNPVVRLVQLCLNVLVLGLWSGSFLSLSLLSNILSNGFNVWFSVTPLLLVTAAFIYPLFGKKGHYCAWLCPLGSCQELIGKAVPYKIKMSPKTIQILTEFREALWLVLMAVMWLGVGFELLDYELFAAFMFRSASVPLLVAAGLFGLLSAVVQRPYCRFVCPTGTLIKFAQSSK